MSMRSTLSRQALLELTATRVATTTPPPLFFGRRHSGITDSSMYQPSVSLSELREHAPGVAMRFSRVMMWRATCPNIFCRSPVSVLPNTQGAALRVSLIGDVFVRLQIEHEDAVGIAALKDAGHGRPRPLAHVGLPFAAQPVGSEILGASVGEPAGDLAGHDLYAVESWVGEEKRI